MQRFALAVLLALSVVGLSGCGAKGTSTSSPSTSVTTSSTATASADASPQAGPGSTAWNTEVAAYFAKWNAVNARVAAVDQTILDLIKSLDAGEKPSKEQIAKQAEASKAYPQLIADAQAVVPPAELKQYHTLWLKTLAAGRDGMAAMADAMADPNDAKMEKAGTLSDAQSAAQAAQDAELTRFNDAFKTSFK